MKISYNESCTTGMAVNDIEVLGKTAYLCQAIPKNMSDNRLLFCISPPPVA